MDPVTSTAPEETCSSLATLTSSASSAPSPTPSQDAGAATSETNVKMSSSSAMLLDLLCIDPNGLCLTQKGTSLPASHAGTYSALLRLASKLSATQSLLPSTLNNSTNSASAARSGASPTTGRGKAMRLRVSIESDQGSVLIQNKNGYTIALNIPSEDCGVNATAQ